MTANLPLINQNDPAAFAAEVRDLAFQAHRMLTRPDASPTELCQLSRRISRLRTQMKVMISDELSDWLDKLSSRVESRQALAGGTAPPRLADRSAPAFS